MAYADYAFYEIIWHGEMQETAFLKWADRASMEIDRITRQQASSAPDSMAQQLRLCCCALADAMAADAALDADTHHGAVASENVDGYSVSYHNKDNAGSRNTLLHNLCSDYLTWPVNLMYAGVQ